MNIFKEKIAGNITVTSDSQYNNVDAENVVIEKNITARLYGNITGTLTLKEGARLYLHGEFSGRLQNEGGKIYTFSR